MSLHNFLIVSFEKTCQKLGLRASSRVPNTSKQMKELGLRPRAFICFSVFGTRDEALALVFDILLIDLRQPIPKRSRCRGHIVISWMFTGVVKQALFATISSISVPHPLNFKHFLWHVIFLLQDTGGIT